MDGTDLSIWLAFGAGFLSFISPCCLPLYPSFLSYITGVSVKELEEQQGLIKKTALYHTLFFILGFSIIFFALGFSASLIGNLFSANRELIQRIGGVLVIAMGLVTLGIFNPQWMMKEKRIHLKKKPIGYAGSVLVGITYAAGWTPCIGPILASILTVAVSNPDQAFWYLLAYTVGFAIPFFVMAFFIGKVKNILKYSNLMMKIGGGLMIVTGVMLYTDQMTKLTAMLIDLFGGFTGF